MGNSFLGTYADDAAATAAVPAGWGTLGTGAEYAQTVSGNIRVWNGSAWTGTNQDDATETAAIASGNLATGSWTVQGTGADCRNYKSITYHITCTAASTCTKFKGKILWCTTLAGTYGEAQCEGTPSSGVVTANDWEADISIGGKVATFTVPWNVPVGGAFCKIELESDLGTPTVSVTYMRKGT